MAGEERRLDARFAAVADRAADAAALVYHGVGGWSHWGYRQLAARAAALAADLRRSGATAGAPVAVVGHRHPDTIAALLAALRLGCPFLPLDPRDPPARRQRLREASGAAIELEASVDASSGAATPAIRVTAAPRIEVPWTADEPAACVMFTSGSTGAPRGVAVPHRAILRLVTDQDYMRFDATRVFLQSIPLSFDASLLEVFGALLHGGRCVLYPSGALPTPAGLRGVIGACDVTTACFTASLFHTLVDADVACLDGLEELVVGGEPLSVTHVRRALGALPRTQLINGYGPTENGVQTTCHRIPRHLPADLPRIPIGRSIRGTGVLVVDARLQPVPPGTEGELLATGEGLALGYVGDPAATQERFVDVAAPGGAPQRAYRTGDRVVERDDGSLDFLGRLDEQVKLDGHRVEPGEAEAVLARIEGVRQCRVVVQADPTGRLRLVAYAVLAPPFEPDVVLRAAAAMLPGYLVPARCVALDLLPLTPHGKLDRAALPDPWQGAGPADPSPPPPPSPRQIVERAWLDVLGRSVGADANFFDAGGRSLDAVRLHERLELDTGLSLEPTFVYEFPNIARQAAALAGLRASAGESCL